MAQVAAVEEEVERAVAEAAQRLRDQERAANKAQQGVARAAREASAQRQAKAKMMQTLMKQKLNTEVVKQAEETKHNEACLTLRCCVALCCVGGARHGMGHKKRRSRRSAAVAWRYMSQAGASLLSVNPRARGCLILRRVWRWRRE